MRIGTLQSVNIERWIPSYQRTTVQKQVPGFIVTQTYDIVSRKNTLTIKGKLTGTSQSDLATKAMTLRGYSNQKKVVWIDASDVYQGYCELVRITDLEGPSIDSSNGVLIADFTLKCAMLAPWGTVAFNPWASSLIAFRDANGVGLEVAMNPLEFNCNFALNEIGYNPPFSFSTEFIVQNIYGYSQVAVVEIMLPDNITPAGTTGIEVQTWNGSAFVDCMLLDKNGNMNTASTPYTMDGTAGSTRYGSIAAAEASYNIGAVGATVNRTYGSIGNSTLQYLTSWGTNNRLAIAFQLPAGQLDPITGNIPSNALSGTAAADKILARIIVNFGVDDTTYVGM